MFDEYPEVDPTTGEDMFDEYWDYHKRADVNSIGDFVEFIDSELPKNLLL